MKKTIAALALAVSVAGPALAAPGDGPFRRLEWIGSDGQAASANVTAAKADWFRQRAQQLTAGTLVMTVDGRFYVLQDAKMADGRSISQMMLAP